MPLTGDDDKVIEGVGEKAKMGAGNDEIVISKTNPITRTDESRRRRRDLTEAGEEPKTEGGLAKAVEQGEEEKAVEGVPVAITEDGQYVDAQGVRNKRELVCSHIKLPTSEELREFWFLFSIKVILCVCNYGKLI